MATPGALEVNVEADDSQWVNYSSMDKSKYTSLLASFGFLSTFVTHPLNVLVTRQQASSSLTGDGKQRQSVRSALKNIVKSHGYRALFRGWAPIAIAGIPTQTTYFLITESTRETLQSSLHKLLPNSSAVVVDGVQSIASSVIANALSLLTYTPAEVVSSRLIVQSTQSVYNSIEMSRVIVGESGWKGLYRGYNSSLVVCTMLSASWWWAYTGSRRHSAKYEYLRNNPLVMDGVCGLVAGTVATCCSHPFDTVKTRIMTSSSKQYSSMFKAMMTVVRVDGAKALLRGIVPSIYMSCISSTGFAMAYELIKRFSTSPSSV